MAPVTPQGHCRVIASCLVLEGLAGCELERKMQVPSEAWEEVLGALMGGHFVCKGFLQYREWANRHLPMCYVLSGRSPGEGNGNLLRYACLGNAVDRGAWWATIHGITKSQTCLSTHTHVRTHTHTHTHTHILGTFFFSYFSSFFYSTSLLNACCSLSLLTSCPRLLTGGRQTIVEGLLLCYCLYAHWPHENSKAFLLNKT